MSESKKEVAIDMAERAQAKVIKADKSLQAKVGTGPLDEKVVERCQEVMDNNMVDFKPLAMEYLDQLGTALEKVRSGINKGPETIQAIAEPVMQLKANAATFKYTLIGNLANIMLSFLETIKEIDGDVLEILTINHKTLAAIVSKKIQGDGGAYGTQMEDELKAACKRYFSKLEK